MWQKVREHRLGSRSGRRQLEAPSGPRPTRLVPLLDLDPVFCLRQ